MDVCQIACRWGPLLANPTHVYLRLASLWLEYLSRPRSQVPSSHAGVSTHAGEPKALRVGTMASTGIVGLVSYSSWEWSVSRFAMHLQLAQVAQRYGCKSLPCLLRRGQSVGKLVLRGTAVKWRF